MPHLIQEAVRRAIHESRTQGLARVTREQEIDLLEYVLQRCRERQTNLHGMLADEQARAAFALYLTMLDLARSIIVCATNRCSIAVPTLGRQLLDAFVDLKNTCASDTYVRHLNVKDMLGWKAALEQASTGRNAYFKSFYDASQLSTWRREHAEQAAQATREGIRELGIEDRFKRAGMTDVYHSVWKLLSAHVHNGISALSGRHFDVSEHGVVTVGPSEGRTPYEMPALTHSTELLIDASETIHGKYGKDALTFVDVRARCEPLWAKIIAQSDG
jgi:hypothetical protein